MPNGNIRARRIAIDDRGRADVVDVIVLNIDIVAAGKINTSLRFCNFTMINTNVIAS
jgi:hypothetical protein